MADQNNDTSQTKTNSRWKAMTDWRKSKTAGALRNAGSSLMDSGRAESSSAASDSIRPVQYRHGGKVRKTGAAVVHKGERVIPRAKVRSVEKLMKRAKLRMKSR